VWGCGLCAMGRGLMAYGCRSGAGGWCMGKKKVVLTRWKGLESLVSMFMCGMAVVLLDWGRAEVEMVARAIYKAVESNRIL